MNYAIASPIFGVPLKEGPAIFYFTFRIVRWTKRVITKAPSLIRNILSPIPYTLWKQLFKGLILPFCFPPSCCFAQKISSHPTFSYIHEFLFSALGLLLYSTSAPLVIFTEHTLIRELHAGFKIPYDKIIQEAHRNYSESRKRKCSYCGKRQSQTGARKRIILSNGQVFGHPNDQAAVIKSTTWDKA
jgi:hypothetical protein